ncbi:MAG: alcohol dehydrogenase [Chromatiales bacterium 21-64-14]|nr:MAG: alcohol dehydrogenase [Chromatiales bacterium 21-64-14]HQU16685.1 zinc-dependent alcohol dehydrogenase family protein [Gammaproteobacteria bacterium]
MKAAVMTAAGGPSVLKVQDAPRPEIETSSEMLVRLKAAGVNPVDTKLRARGTYFPDRMPTILGCDGAGVVEAVGEDVHRFQAGDEVYFCNGGIGGHPGNYAEYAVVDEMLAAHKPTTLDFTAAAALPLVTITAWESLYDRGRLKAGQRILIHAGAGGVGHVAIQLALVQDAWVCTTVGSREKADFVTRLGVHEAVLYRETDFVQAVLAWSGGEGADLILDTVGGDTFVRSFGAARFYADLVTLLQPGPEVDWKEARSRNLRISYELMLSPMLHGLRQAQQHHAQVLEACAQLVDEGRLRVHVNETFPLDQAAKAHALLEKGSLTGKLVLEIP